MAGMEETGQRRAHRYLRPFRAVNLPSSEGAPHIHWTWAIPLWGIREERGWEEGPKHGQGRVVLSQQLPQ